MLVRDLLPLLVAVLQLIYRMMSVERTWGASGASQASARDQLPLLVAVPSRSLDPLGQDLLLLFASLMMLQVELARDLLPWLMVVPPHPRQHVEV